MKKIKNSKLLSYEVYQDGEPVEDIDLGKLPKDMSDPESWKEIAQVCKDNLVDIICFLDKPYKGCSIMAFKSSGNYLFIGEGVEEDAYNTFITNADVFTFSAKLSGHTQRLYYVWDDVFGRGHILFNGDEDDTTENRVTSSESFGPVTSLLMEMPGLKSF